MDSAIETVSAAVAGALRDALDGVDPSLPPPPAPDPAAARAALADLPGLAQAVTTAGDPAAWIGAVDAWRDRVRDAVDGLYGGPAGPDAALARFLEERLPRVAALLSLGGIITHPPGGPADIDWAKVETARRDPGALAGEQLFQQLLGGPAPGLGRLPAVLVGLLLAAPQTILALARGDTKVAPLPAPPTDAPGPWRTFRESSEGWISITVPVGDPARPTPHPGGIFDLVADLDPDLSATVAIRSDRVAVPGGTRTLFEAWLALAVEGDRWQLDLGSDWYLRLEPGLSAGFGHGADGDWHGAFRQFVLDQSLAPGPGDPVELTLGREVPGGAPDILLGPPYDTRLVIRDLGLFLRVREDHPIVEVGAFVHGLSAVLTNRWWRTFGITDTLFQEGIRLDLDLDIAYVEGRGLLLNLASDLRITFGIEKKFGSDKTFADFILHSITLAVPVRATQDGIDVRAEVRFHISLRLGPVTMVADGMGGWFGYWADGGEKEYVGFLPPTGAGLKVDAGVVAGGGFLDFTGGPSERFGGVLYLRIGLFEVTAFGLHELTGQPGDAARERSLVLVLGIRFIPGIQLGFGFEIAGFGGLLGIHRRIDTDALRERLTSGAAGNVLFNDDPIRNAPSILGDLRALFPPEKGHHVFGPTVRLAWLRLGKYQLVSLDVGIFFELPGPARVVLLGSARAQVPPIPGSPKLIDIRFDIVGFIDVPKQVVEFDATLISSHVLYVFHLTGDLAFRLKWGSQPHLLLSLGGFHPRFETKPAQFPELTRLALTLDSEYVPGGVFFRAEAYIAVTSNTLQFGAKVELGYKAGPLNLVGFLALDAIIQFDPFWFEVSISAGVRLRWNSTTLAGVRLEGIISGPGPFTITGKACFEILWFDICADATVTLGSAGEPPAPRIGSVPQALQPDLAEPANLQPVGAEDPQAAVQPRPTPAGAPPVVSPLGRLRWTQKRVPFGVRLDRYEGRPLDHQQRVVITSPQGTGAVDDWFAPGSYCNLTEAESLNRPAYERLAGGIDIGFAGQRSSAAVRHEVTVIELRLPRRQLFLVSALALPGIIAAAVADRDGPARAKTTAPKVGVTDPVAVVRGTDGSVLGAPSGVTAAFQEAKAVGGIAVHPADLVDIGAL